MCGGAIGALVGELPAGESLRAQVPHLGGCLVL